MFWQPRLSAESHAESTLAIPAFGMFLWGYLTVTCLELTWILQFYFLNKLMAIEICHATEAHGVATIFMNESTDIDPGENFQRALNFLESGDDHHV